MNYKAISRNVGFALLVCALFMFLSILVSLIYNDGALTPLVISFIITFTLGAFPFIFVRRSSSISLRDGFVIIFLSWLMSFVFGMLPYALWGGPFDLSNAWFESVSGFTTTGATILEDIEALPKSLLFWRSSTHFIGGLGVVVFLLLILPNTSPMKLRLTSLEVSNLSKNGYRARSNQTSSIFAYVYLGLMAMAFIAFLIVGMSPFDAVCHAFSVCATGGFSTKNLSLGAYDSLGVEIVTIVFLFLASIHFGSIYLAVVKRSLKPFKNPVFFFYLGSLIVTSTLLAVSLKFQDPTLSVERAIREGVFQTISTASTSGFAITDNLNWGFVPNYLLIFVALMCGCAGSTSCGIKVDRIMLLFKRIGLHVGRILNPSAVNEVRLGRVILKDEDINPHTMYINIYFLVMLVSILLVSLTGLSGEYSFAGSLAMLSNVGPSIGRMGTMGNYNWVPDTAKFLFTLDMFLGRVEIYPILAVMGMLLGLDNRK
ncbi:MAG: TrkH family potassium uptake protein [Bacteroidales bacterium]|nr:TrkH family potassium uptake protein [Bacteroidales bacterium]MBQ3983871.1 TrkH family potassium uptake protein [Bacteroidales bacterium]